MGDKDLKEASMSFACYNLYKPTDQSMDEHKKSDSATFPNNLTP